MTELPRPPMILSLEAYQELDEARQELSFIVALLRNGDDMDALSHDEYMGAFLALGRIRTRLNLALATVEDEPTAT